MSNLMASCRGGLERLSHLRIVEDWEAVQPSNTKAPLPPLAQHVDRRQNTAPDRLLCRRYQTSVETRIHSDSEYEGVQNDLA